jgi:hypothetical protein
LPLGFLVSLTTEAGQKKKGRGGEGGREGGREGEKRQLNWFFSPLYSTPLCYAKLMMMMMNFFCFLRTEKK